MMVYELPLNERVRILLRLEHVLHALEQAVAEPSLNGAQLALIQLADALSLTDRSELKKDLLKELEKHSYTLGQLRERKGVDLEQLDRFLRQIDHLREQLSLDLGKPAQALREHPLLKTYQQRQHVAGGLSPIDFPWLQQWLHQPTALRQQQLQAWMDEFRVTQEAVGMVLGMVRESSRPKEVIAEQGFYQQNLDTSLPYQMVRVLLPNAAPWFAEISGGKHRFSVRMLNASTDGRPQQVQKDIPFRLCTCML